MAKTSTLRDFPDRIQFADEGFCIAGMGRTADCIDAAVSGAVKTRRDQAEKPVKCVPRSSRTLACPLPVDDAPAVLRSPADEARRAVVDYRKAWRNILGRAS